MTFRPRIVDAGTSVLGPQLLGHGEPMWPRCLTCKRAVSAYGIAEETKKFVEFWCRCDGIADPYGGQHVRSYRAGIRINKLRFPGGWTENSMSAILPRLCLRPGKFAKWSLEMDGSLVAPS